MSSSSVLLLDPLGLLLAPRPAASPAAVEIEIPPKLWRYIALSDVWGAYERGLSQDLDSVVSLLAELPLVRTWDLASSAESSPTDQGAMDVRSCIRRAIDRHRRNLMEVPEMVEQLQLLRSGKHPNPRLLLGRDDPGIESSQKWRLVCVSNMSKEELHDLRLRFPAFFGLFDELVVSCEEGVRLPSMALLRRAMERLGVSGNPYQLPQDLDSSIPQNDYVGCYYFAHASCMQSVTAARSLGLRTTRLLCRPSSTSTVLAEGSGNDMYLIHNQSLSKHDHEDDDDNDDDLHPAPPSSALRRAISETRLEKAIASARHYLLNCYPTSFQFPSLTSHGVFVFENFSRFLIADVLCDSRFLPMQNAPPSGLIFFLDKNAPLLIDAKYSSKLLNNPTFNPSFFFRTIPEDLDTTAIGLSILHKFGKVGMDTINQVLAKMLDNYVCDMDGILQVYFDVHRPRIDPIAIVNTIYLFHLTNRGHEVEKSEQFVYNALYYKAYEGGTLYYNTNEGFLLQLSRLVNAFDCHFTKTGMKSLLLTRLQQHKMQTQMGECNCLALAMYMRSCLLCGIGNTKNNEKRLLQLQRNDGSWCGHPYYCYGSNRKIWFSNDGLTTSYALSTLENGIM